MRVENKLECAHITFIEREREREREKHTKNIVIHGKQNTNFPMTSDGNKGRNIDIREL